MKQGSFEMPVAGMPIVGDTMTNPNPGLAAAIVPWVPVAGGGVVYHATAGNASWVGATFQVAAAGPVNFRFVPALPNTVSYCVVPGVGAANPIYVISDQYGGCELHELYNAGLNALAFLHVYRGGGITTPYVLNAGWVLRTVKRSAMIANAHGMAGSNWSFTQIDRSVVPPIVTSKFIHLAYPTVTGEDAGNTPYPVAFPCTIL